MHIDKRSPVASNDDADDMLRSEKSAASYAYICFR
jgi:hypothetical protein